MIEEIATKTDLSADTSLQRFVASLPHLPGVYRMIDEGSVVLYVGKAKNLFKRVRSYFSSNALSPRIRLMVSQIHHIDMTVTRSESEALLLENNLIKELNPRYNIIFRDDKSYAYLCVTRHDTPQIRYHRGALKTPHRYFGPYPSNLAVKEGIEVLQKVFRLRTCEDSVLAHRSRPCMLYQINRCSAPCVGAISAEDYALDVKAASQFLEGKGEAVMATLQQQMEQAALELRFEQAASLRDRLKCLQKLRERQFVHSTDTREQSKNVDVFCILYHENMMAINWVAMRGGRHCGERSFFPSRSSQTSWENNEYEESLDDILQNFLIQYYQQQALPDSLVLSLSAEGLTLLKEAFSQFSTCSNLPNFVISPTGAKKVWLEMAQLNAKLAIEHRLKVDQTQQERLIALQQAFEWRKTIQRIECFDISHTQGQMSVASCVVFDEGYMQPKQYRRFNVTPEQAGDDYAAMQEVLTRRTIRLIEGESTMPDLWLIDGGAGQFSVAKRVLEEQGLTNTIQIMGIAKGEARIQGLEQLLIEENNHIQTITLPANHSGLHLLQHIRNEAHRFAIEGHRAKRAKAGYESILDSIAGIGAKRKKALLIHFGGIKALESASQDEIASVQGISSSLAEIIYQRFHP